MKSQHINRYHLLILSGVCQFLLAQKVKLNHKPDLQKIDITIDGDYFTSYIYPDNLEKTVLYPVMAANGHYVTRGFPIESRPNERVDHPRQVGVWLNYGEVNELDFWNNSYAIPPEKKNHYGSIEHINVNNIESAFWHNLLRFDWHNLLR